MTVKELYVACQNISLDSTFNLYGNQFTYNERIKPLYSCDIKSMNDTAKESEVIRFFIDVDTVECLILL